MKNATKEAFSMNETKFEPFIKGSMAMLTLCAIVCMAVFISKGSEIGRASCRERV